MNFLKRYFRKSPPVKKKPEVLPVVMRSKSPTQKDITREAILDASKISLPKNASGLYIGEYDDWKSAFKWYNQHIHIGNHPLGMGCRPCFTKVYLALQAAQKIKQDD